MKPSPNQTDNDLLNRQDQVYSKLPVFGDGWYWLSDPSCLMISGRPQMMSCLRMNQQSRYVCMHWHLRQPILIWVTQFLQPEYTLDLLNMHDEYHTDIIRSNLTRNIAATFNEVREELIMAMDDLTSTHEDSSTWQSLKLKTTTHRECRVGQGSHSRWPCTCDLPCHESYFCWSSSMFVFHILVLRSHHHPVLIFLSRPGP
jgi:hypothetical protein